MGRVELISPSHSSLLRRPGALLSSNTSSFNAIMMFFFTPSAFLFALLAIAGFSDAMPVIFGNRGTATVYMTGQNNGCNITTSESDSVVALSATWFKPDSCGKKVKVSARRTASTVHATIVDYCLQCKANDLQISPQAFHELGGIDGTSRDIVWDPEKV
ncbi:hypothetical protein BC835DRAFT_1421553 [Cytidiella melzeri]|nr:hypothetical protein BC835DRAFT_1421553 [Cytidiella melzeri]